MLSDNDLSENNIDSVICSGMITSELGLINLPHLILPSDTEAMHRGIEYAEFPEISSIPFAFIRGLKTSCENLASSDMMRGEETELAGLCTSFEPNCLYILPGSHSKHIYTDDHGRIVDFSTHMTGELIAAVSGHTILSGSINLNCTQFDAEYLEKGFNYTKEQGINAALFKVRTLKVLFNPNDKDIYSFFMGVVLHGEIESIIKSSSSKTVIGGKAALKLPMAHLLNKYSDKELITVPDEISDSASVRGAIRIYENC